MDVSSAIVAKSEQLNAVDLVGRDVTVTILDVKQGDRDQPVHIITDTYGPSRPWKPSKTALRDIVQVWGTDSTVWVGRRLTLFNDPEVLWAGQAVGGVRIRAMSHIEKPFEAKHVITRGKTKKVMIQPLEDVDRAVVEKALTAITNATSTQQLDSISEHATRIGISAAITNALNTRRKELTE